MPPSHSRGSQRRVAKRLKTQMTHGGRKLENHQYSLRRMMEEREWRERAAASTEGGTLELSFARRVAVECEVAKTRICPATITISTGCVFKLPASTHCGETGACVPERGRLL